MQRSRGSKSIMKAITKWTIFALFGFSSAVAKDFRPPAVPLITPSNGNTVLHELSISGSTEARPSIFGGVPTLYASLLRAG